MRGGCAAGAVHTLATRAVSSSKSNWVASSSSSPSPAARSEDIAAPRRTRDGVPATREDKGELLSIWPVEVSPSAA